MITTAKVLRFAKFGAFVELDHSLEGLIHISEISKEPVLRPEDALKIGDLVEVKVLRVIPEEQKIGLSIKEAVKQKEKPEAKPATPPAEEVKKVTIGDMIAQKEKERAERESEETAQDEEASVN
jgi:4-hydroxy-3-methylbut-2-enyl diphosphate reductase